MIKTVRLKEMNLIVLLRYMTSPVVSAKQHGLWGTLQAK
jgi:hypothetical protein